jgi:hypothetical protein
MRDGKKKLPLVDGPGKTVLPEVLPDPRRPRDAPSAPRSRTVAHMQRLLATAAAVGVASFSCGKERAANDGTVERGCGKGKRAGSSGDPNASSGGTSSGYAVVDPMPTPAHCPDIAPLVKATAKFVAGDGGGVLLEVRMPKPEGRADYNYIADAQPVIYGGTLVKRAIKDDGVDVTVRPDANATTVMVSVHGRCDKGPGTLAANVSWKGPAAIGTAPGVFVSEY